MKLSVIIPAKMRRVILKPLEDINEILLTNKIEHEIIVINDHSHDSTLEILNFLKKILMNY